jgi:hypothetical protein
MKPIACMLLAAALILAVTYFYNGEHAVMEAFQHRQVEFDIFQHLQAMEAFQHRQSNQDTLMFNGSYPSPPVVCLAGNSKIPCTAFSSG